MHWLRYTEIDSTQKVAISLAKEGAAEGVAVLSEIQTAGKSRRGEGWSSPAGGLYFSVVVHPDLMGLHLLSLTTGLEIQRELKNHSSLPLLLKWPGDVVVENADGQVRKLADVLTDVVNPTGLLPVAVVGLNMNAKKVQLPPDVAPHAVCLEEIATAPLKLEEIEEPLIGAVIRASKRISDAEERSVLGREINEVLWGVGRAVSIDGRKGIFVGIGAAGEAIVATEKGEEVFWSGDMRVVDK
jgi:BirA family biotin operon repressor/biotin-[acetyl-CoA-carboxylase] ligase